jgi:autotransporter-associated beta strand protein
VTYADANFNSSTRVPSNVTLIETGTANGTVSVSGSGLTRTVSIGGISGNGTLGISIAAGTASDLAGNLAPAAGPSATFIVDNIAPTITIGPPSVSYTTGEPITYSVTYADQNFNTSTLALSNIALIETGTASGTLGLTGSGLSYMVTISSIAGDGSLGISIGPGTASDLAGNLAPAAGPSATFAVDTTGPTLVTPAGATLDPAGTSADLSVLGTDISTGAGSLTYTWIPTLLPNGAAPPSFLPNGTNGSNAAQDITAAFTQAGDYAFQVTIADPYGLSTTSTVNVQVNQLLLGITVSPSVATLAAGATQQFTAVADDQFGNPWTPPPTFLWSVGGGGDIDSNGLYTPPYAGGTATVFASSGGAPGTASVHYSGEAQWAAGSDGSWAGNGNWEDAISQTILANPPGVRGVVGDTVLFSSTAGNNVMLDGADPSLAALTFNSGSSGFTLAAGTGGTLYLDNGISSANITVSAGSQTISAPMALTSSVMVLPATGSQLTLSGPIGGTGSSLTLDGGGKLVLGGQNTYTGGTKVAAGTLDLASPTALAANTSLMIGADAGLLFGSSLDAAPSAIAATPAIVSRADGTAMFITKVSASGGTAKPSSAAAGDPAGRTPVQSSTTEAARLVALPLLASAPASPTKRPDISVPAADRLVRSSAASRIAADLAWLTQTAQGSDNSEQRRKKDVAILALDAVFAKYEQ